MNSAGTIILETERVRIRKLNLDDAAFMLELLNEPDFIRFIGDRGVRSLADARSYLENGPLAAYERLGFGLWLVQRRLDGESLGICGLVKRDSLPDIDIGYAFLERFRGQGYALEAAAAVKEHSLGTLGLPRLLGVTDPDNLASIRLLEKLGLRYQAMVRLSGSGPELKLFATRLTGSG